MQGTTARTMSGLFCSCVLWALGLRSFPQPPAWPPSVLQQFPHRSDRTLLHVCLGPSSLAHPPAGHTRQPMLCRLLFSASLPQPHICLSPEPRVQGGKCKAGEHRRASGRSHRQGLWVLGLLSQCLSCGFDNDGFCMVRASIGPTVGLLSQPGGLRPRQAACLAPQDPGRPGTVQATSSRGKALTLPHVTRIPRALAHRRSPRGLPCSKDCWICVLPGCACMASCL